MIRIAVQNLDKLLSEVDQVPARAALARDAVAALVAKRVAEKVKDRIPSGGGWLDIYRESIQFVELEPGAFGVSGVAEVPFSYLEAEQTLLWFQQGDTTAQILGQYNPWVIDAIPAVQGGIFSDVLVRPASESEVRHHRERLSGQLTSINMLLDRAGVSVEANGLPMLNGKVYADLDFMSRRLEYGLGGFPRVPHWGPAVADAERISNSAEVTNALNKALFEGKSTVKNPPPNEKAADHIRRSQGS